MTLSAEARGMMFAEETGDGLLVLLTIDHAELAVPIRVVNNQVDVTSRGDLFTAFPFELTLPTNEPDRPPQAQLVIDNVSREIGQAIRTVTSSPTVLIEAVRINDFDALELAFPAMNLRNVRFDVAKVTGDLMSEDLQLEPYPAYTFSPAHFPGLF